MTPPQKERIIDQAMHMFVSQGIKSVRMDDIAQQLGVSKRTLYEMFGDKEGLLYLAMERYSERNRQRWNELTADAHDVLEAMFMVLGEVMDNAEVSRRELMLPDGMSEREAFVQIISNFFRGISTAKGLQLIDDNLKRYRLSKTGNKLNLDR